VTASAATAAAPPTLYLDRCAGGCALTPGADDSRLNRSSLITGARELSDFAFGDVSWNAVVDCVRDTFAPFAIAVSDSDPGAAEHIEVMVAGAPQQIGMPTGVGVVSPVTCEGDRVVENGIGFAFANVFGDVPLEICWSASQAAGSLLGLDHALLAGDVMTYLNGPLPKRFVDEAAACGEFAPRGCQCGGTTQNSHQHLVTTLPEPGPRAGLAAVLVALAFGARRVAPRSGARSEARCRLR